MSVAQEKKLPFESQAEGMAQPQPQADRLLAALIDSPTIVFEQDINLRFTWIYNHDPAGAPNAESIIGKRDADLVSAEDAQRLTQIKQQVLDCGIASRQEVMVTHNGAYRYFDLTIKPRYEGDSVVGISGVATDITKYKQIEQRYQMLFDKNPNPMWICDIDTLKFLEVNDAALVNYGYSRSEFLGMKVPDLQAPENRAKVLQAVNDQKSSCSYSHLCEVSHRKQDGTIIDVEISTHALNWQGKSARCVLAKDISAQKTALRDREESEARFRAIFEQAAVGVSYTDMRGNFVVLNQRYANILDYSKEELLSKRFQDVTHPDDLSKDLAHFERLLAGEIPNFSIEKRYCRQDGSYVWTNLTVSLIHNRSGEPKYSIGIIQDISDRKSAEAAIQQLNAELEAKVVQRTAELQAVNQQLMTEIIEKQHTTDALNLQVERLNKMYSLVAALNQATTTDEIYTLAITGITGLLKTQRASIMIRDGGRAPRYVASIGISEAYKQAVEDYLGQRNHWQEPEAIVISKLEDTVGDVTLNMMRRAENIRSAASFPIKYQEQKLGKIIIYYDTPHQFDDEEIQLAQAIANYVSVSLTRKQAEAQLQQSLQEKEVLLKEIHHRVKNNLQVVSGLLMLQARSIDDPNIKTLFEDSQNRIHSMALIHEKLYRSSDLSQISFKNYLQDLMHSLAQSYNVDAQRVHFHVEVEPLSLSIESATPCGLIVNELITNALKHAFCDRRSGNIRLTCDRNNEGQVCLTISDNGVGLPESIDIGRAKSLGLQLVYSLTKQLKGTITLDRSNGTTFQLRFKELEDRREA